MQPAIDASNLPTICKLEDYGGIAQALSVVEQLRQQRLHNSAIAQRTLHLRQWQVKRFRDAYVDVLQDDHMRPAALFFLTELYGGQEYAQRDAQFARIAAAIERIFPQSVVQTATLLAKLHALSETLDACMAIRWESICSEETSIELASYKLVWQSLLDVPGYAKARQQQLDATQQLGVQLQRHTQVPGLRLMLKMMRVPAASAGLQDLQRFLEHGFDTFGTLGRVGKLSQFLAAIDQRESAWLAQMAA